MLSFVFVPVDAYWAYRNAIEAKSNPSPVRCGNCTCHREKDIVVVESCEISLGVILAHDIEESRVDMTKLFASNEKKIEIFNTSIKTIMIDQTISTQIFDFMMFKENYRLELRVQEFGKVYVSTVLFRIRALKYLERETLLNIFTLQFFSMNHTKFNLGNQQKNIWSRTYFQNLEIRGPHTIFSMIESCQSLRYVEFGIISTSHPPNVIPDGFLRDCSKIETIYIHRSRNFILPVNFMNDLSLENLINMTVNLWNVNKNSLSNQTKLLNGVKLNDTQRRILNGFGGQEAKNCKWFCDCQPNGPGACGHCDDDWHKQNCGICVRNLLGANTDIHKHLRGICFLENSEVINDTKMPPPYPTWAPGDYQPNMGNDYEGVTRRRALGFGATSQVGLIFLIVLAFLLKRRYRLHLFFYKKHLHKKLKVISSKKDDYV